MNTAPAFKEWQVIVEALVAGEQIIILRKGGIAEGRDGFQMQATRFWLFPTQFHEQRDKTKPAAARFASVAPTSSEGTITLRAWAEVVVAVFLPRWEEIARLDRFHLWSEATVRDRFEWDSSPGLYVLVVRVHRLHTPIELPLTSEMGGCKSWIDLPVDFSHFVSSPVLDDVEFEARRRELMIDS